MTNAQMRQWKGRWVDEHPHAEQSNVGEAREACSMLRDSGDAQQRKA